MSKRTLLNLFGAALILSAASVASGATHPGAAQTPTTHAKKKRAASKSRKSKLKGQTAPNPDRIREIQTALQKDGSYEGEPTGKWDEATMDAMKKYQDKNGLSATGKIDASTLEKLGLGADTAGKGAPVPAASSAASPSNPPSAK